VTFTVTGPGTGGPLVTSVVNAASLQPGPLVAGSLAAIFGSSLGGTHVSVTFDDAPAALLYAGASQINLQVPDSLAGKTSARMVVTVDGQSSAPQTVALAEVAPAIFNPGVLNQDNIINSASQPAALGSVIQIFCTGLVSTGSGVISARLAGLDIAKPSYGGPAPGIPGLQQVNLVIPANLPPGAVQVEVCAVTTHQSQPICSMPGSVSVK